MTPPAGVQWASSLRDGRCHVVQPAGEARHGYRGALCGMTLPDDGLPPVDIPQGRWCWLCAVEIARQDPGTLEGALLVRVPADGTGHAAGSHGEQVG